jgi:hypothetical protein
MTTHWLHQLLQVNLDKYIIICPELFHTDSLLLLATRLIILGITSELDSHVRFDLYLIPTTWTWIKRNLAVGRWVPSIHSRGNFAREKISIYQISTAGITSEPNSHVRFDLNVIPTTQIWTKRNLAVANEYQASILEEILQEKQSRFTRYPLQNLWPLFWSSKHHQPLK